MGECMDDEWVNEEGDSFLFDFSRGNKGIYNTIKQRYACILCFKVCTYVHDDTREWMGSNVCGNDERESCFFVLFLSFFFNFLVFWKKKKKSWPKEIANATDRDAFLRLRIFFLPLWILLLLLWTEEDEKIKNKVKKSEKLRGERERREMKTSIYYIASNSLQPSNVSKAWKGMRGKKKGGRGRRIIGK